MNESQFYQSVYSDLQRKGAQGWFIRKTHEALENSPVVSNGKSPDSKILEVGGNIGEHIPYVKGSLKEYLLTDYRNTNPIFKSENIKFAQEDVQRLTFPNDVFDRTISTCLLHHVRDLEEALVEMRRVTKNGGIVSILLPCDPGILYRLAKAIGPNRKWKKQGITQYPWRFHYKQHINHFPGIMAAIGSTFEPDHYKVKYWPFVIKSWNLNLFATIQVKVEKNE